ncbi:MAG: radical SAM protein [Bacillota bacterium]|nr:radical SAM protein [Bacillota bacterium]
MNKRHYIIPIFVPHEGCPHNCVFCNQNSITGQLQSVNAEMVRTTVEQYFETMDRKNSIIEISFFGGTFTAIPSDKQVELLTAAKKYKDSGCIDYIRLSTRPDYIDDEILTRLRNFSVDIIELGVQSLDDEVLKLAGRGHTKNDSINASRKIKEYGFTLGHQIMLGLPGDDFNKDLNTARDSLELKPDLCRIYPALVLKDTPMEIMYKRGLYKPYTLNEAVYIAKKLYCIYKYNSVNVIRVGLQATDNISEGKDIIAGPHHPAFRELVEGSLLCDMIKDEVNILEGIVNIFINPKYISKLYANKKQYFHEIEKELIPLKLSVTSYDSVEIGSIMFSHETECWNMSINDYISKKVTEGKIYNCIEY